MSSLMKNVSKVLLILMTGLTLGYGAWEVKDRMKPSYSAFEDAKPYAPPTISEIKEAKKPDVGPEVKNEEAKKELQVLVLRKENTLVFNEVVTDESVAKFLVKAQEMSNKLPKTQEIILVLYTPGGSVDAGMNMIDNLNALPQKIKTLTIFSASMGFQFVQNFDERMIIPSGGLMSHRAYGGMEGEIGGEFDVRYNAIKRQLEYMDNIAAKRMGMTLEKYRELIRDEYWVHGFESVQDRAADKLILARCGDDMVGTEKKTFDVLFFKIKATFSKCPLITGPLEIELERGMGLESDEPEVREFVKLLWENPKGFWKNYIKTQKYQTYLTKPKN